MTSNQKEYFKQYYKDNEEKIKKQKRKWYEENLERIKKQNVQYRKDNKEKIKKQQKEYSKKHSKKITKRATKWNNENKERHKKISKKSYHKCWKAADRKRRMRVRLNGGSFTIGEWELLKKQYGYRCPMCGKREPEIKLETDHIIPVCKGGSSYIENIQPLCKKCNSIKFTKIYQGIPIK